MMRSQQVENDEWLKVLETDAIATEIRSSYISRLLNHLQTAYRFDRENAEFDASDLERVVENLLRGAAQVAAWALMTEETPGAPIIIHEKNYFQSTKIFTNILTTMGFPTKNIVFLCDPNLEKPAQASYPALFNTKRTFLNGDTKALGAPSAKLRIFIPLNYYFDGWLGYRYPIVIANYLRAFELALEMKPDVDNLASLANISLFFGMYHGLDSYANLDESCMREVTAAEVEALAETTGQIVKVVRASELAQSEHFHQAERLITYIFVFRFDLVVHYFYEDIALYLTLEGNKTVVKKRETTLLSQAPSIPTAIRTNLDILEKITNSVLGRIEKLTKDKEKFANHYAQFISLVLLNFGFANPCPLFQAQIRRQREGAHLRVDLTREKQTKMFENYGIFLEKYVNQTYRIRKHARDRHSEHNLLENQNVPDALPVNNPSFITQQPLVKWNYISEEKLSTLHQNLFQRRSLPAQATALVQAVVQLADEYLEEKETVPRLHI